MGLMICKYEPLTQEGLSVMFGWKCSSGYGAEDFLTLTIYLSISLVHVSSFEDGPGLSF